MPAQAVEHRAGTPRRSLNKWTFEQRLCLDVLWTSQSSKVSLEDRAHIFNTIFRDHLIACGIPGGLSSAAISSQYVERKHTHKTSWKASWERVCAVPKVDLTLRQQLQDKIDAVLQSGNGDIVQAAATAFTMPPTTPRRTDRVRKVVENPYDLVTPGPKTPVWTQRHLQFVHESPNQKAYATPAPIVRKRPAEFTTQKCPVGDTDTDDDYVPKAKKSRKSSPAVIVPPTPSQLAIYQPQQAIPRTPKRRPGEPRQGATMRYVQPSGRELMLKPREHDEASRPLKDVSEEEAHPYPPAMLFRFWHNKSHGVNSSNGFIAGRFVPQRILVEPRGPPDCDTIDMNDIAHHLNNRTGTDQDGVPSPFISTTNNLSWAIRMALKRMDLDAKLSIIDPSMLDPKSIYYVPPFYSQLKKKRCFERGYFGYKGTHEHLIYHKIERSAMVNTFSVQDLIRFSNSDKDVKRVLRLDVMAVSKTPAIEIMKALKHGNLEVNTRVASAVGKIVLFLGVNHKSSREMISRAVFEVLQGWAIKADGKSQEKANAFVKQFQDKSVEYIDISDQLKLKHAFLHGMLWSCGDLNVHIKGRAGHELMQLRALKRGLLDPEMLLVNELNEAMREIAVFEGQQFELHVGPARQMLPAGQNLWEQVDGEDEEDDVVPTQVGRLNLQDRIVYE